MVCSMKDQSVKRKGMTLLLAVLVLSIVMAVGLTLLNFIVKQFNITTSARDSVNAVYAADTGIECALLWDIRGHEAGFYGARVFPTSTSLTIGTDQGINCLNVDITRAAFPWSVTQAASAATTTFELDFPNINACTIVQVAKYQASGRENTTVFSRGYNVPCNATTTSPNAVERAIQVRYIFN